jgi:prepilin-type N-terminal cleavage/methylation domain-containing protein
MIEKLRKDEAGFTLIELLIVVVIIGILAAVGVPIYTRYIQSARASEATTIMHAIIEYAQSYNRARAADGVGTPWPVDAATDDTVAAGDADPAAWMDEVVGGDAFYFIYTFDQNGGTGGEPLLQAEGGAGNTDDAGTILSSVFAATDIIQYDFGATQGPNGPWKSNDKLRDIQPTNPDGSTPTATAI